MTDSSYDFESGIPVIVSDIERIGYHCGDMR